MKYSFRSYLHVIIQFGILGFFAYNGKYFKNYGLLIIEILGVILALWAIGVMRNSVLSIFPNPASGIKLIKKGPYKLIRHPMYASLILVLFPMVISYFTFLRFGLLLIFILNMILKTLYEEKLLKKNVDGYKEYTKNTKMIIPYIF